MHTYIHTYIHSYIHTYIHTCIHTELYSPSQIHTKMYSAFSAVLGYSLVNRAHLDANNPYIIISSPDRPVAQDGVIVGWRAYFRRTVAVTFQVWRLLSGTRYQLVGQTKYTPTKTGVLHITLSSHEEIKVKKGDVTALYNSAGSSVIPFAAKTGACTNAQKIRYTQRGSTGVDQPGNQRTMTALNCRVYSYQAVISKSVSCEI